MKQLVCPKINKRLVRKFDYTDLNAWAMEAYRQFGFRNFGQLLNKSKELGDRWYLKYYWSCETEDEWLNAILALYPRSKKCEILRYSTAFSLYCNPTNVRRGK